MAFDDEQLADILLRLERLESTRPSDVDAAKVLLSGALPRQRIHWSQEITHADRFSITGALAIWPVFLHGGITDWSVAWASGLSSLLLGLWRLNVRNLDAAIAQLYPAITKYEVALGMPSQTSTLRDARAGSDTEESVRRKVEARRMGSRGHLPFDWVALLLIIGMAFATWKMGHGSVVTCCDLNASFHPLTVLAVNALSCFMVVIAMNCFQTNKGGILALLKTRE